MGYAELGSRPIRRLQHDCHGQQDRQFRHCKCSGGTNLSIICLLLATNAIDGHFQTEYWLNEARATRAVEALVHLRWLFGKLGKGIVRCEEIEEPVTISRSLRDLYVQTPEPEMLSSLVLTEAVLTPSPPWKYLQLPGFVHTAGRNLPDGAQFRDLV